MKKLISVVIPYILVCYCGLFLFSCKPEDIKPDQISYSVSLPLAEEAGIVFAQALNMGDSESVITNKKLYINDTDTLLFYFQVDDSVSILIAGDKRIFPLMGYSSSNEEYANKSPEFDCFIQGYVDELIALRNSETQIVDTLSMLFWDYIKISIGGHLQLVTDGCDETNILIPNNNWKQNSPYNDYGYVIGSSHAVVGCGPLAMAMICKFWAYPNSTSGSISYTAGGNNYSGDITYTYDYSSIPWILTFASPNNQKVETNKLMLNAGLALHATFGLQETGIGYSWSPNSTGSVQDPITDGLTTFGFPNTVNLCKNSNTEADWVRSVRDHIMASHPVIYVGNKIGGHAWICDRFKWCYISLPTTKKELNDIQYDAKWFNMKWGWGDNRNNNWYRLDNLTVGGYNFTANNKIYVPIKP